MQLGKDREAQGGVRRGPPHRDVDTEHFAAAFAFTAIPARYTLERRQWAEAAELTLHPKSLAWQKFPQAESILVVRARRRRRAGRQRRGRSREIARLEALRDAMTAAKNTYWAEQAEIQRLAVAGWIARAEKRNDDAVKLLRQAADLEAGTEKHPVTPGAIQPAREMLGEFLLELGQPAQALVEFEASQRTDPNRLPRPGRRGARRRADRQPRQGAHLLPAGLVLAKDADTGRPESRQAKAYLREVARRGQACKAAWWIRHVDARTCNLAGLTLT